MNIDELKAKLIEVLGTELGTLRTASGATQPAIWVVPPQAPAGRKVTGLECIVQEFPQEEKTVPVTGDKVAYEWWVVTLIQWDGEKSTSHGKNLIRKAFEVTKSIDIPVVTVPTAGLTVAQTTIRIFDPIWLSISR